MGKFSKLKQNLDVVGKTAIFELSEIEGNPKPFLILAPATFENQDYFNAALRRSGSRPKGKSLNQAEQIADGIAEMKELWPQYVIKGWGNSRHLNDTGEDIPYTQADGAELLEAFTSDMLIRMKEFANEMGNYRGHTEAPIDVETVAGN
jgi:hypothetical protein